MKFIQVTATIATLATLVAGVPLANSLSPASVEQRGGGFYGGYNVDRDLAVTGKEKRGGGFYGGYNVDKDVKNAEAK